MFVLLTYSRNGTGFILNAPHSRNLGSEFSSGILLERSVSTLWHVPTTTSVLLMWMGFMMLVLTFVLVDDQPNNIQYNCYVPDSILLQ
jgi:hypothetical protein